MMDNNYKNIFEIDNARNEFSDQLPGYFVWTSAFERLMAAKNHVILGARGSGKTALVKMLSHEYLSRCKIESANRIVEEKKLVGTYIPMKLEWIGGLENKNWLSDDDMELFFQWRLNIASCIAFIGTIKSCLDLYVPEEKARVFLEKDLSEEISSKLLDGHSVNSLASLREFLEDLEFSKHADLFRNYLAGNLSAKTQLADYFSAPLFSPLKLMIRELCRGIEFPNDCSWFVCLDEAEFLHERFHRILNSFLRTESSNVFYKITTMPYCHYTLETNTETHLKIGDDFDYVYVDVAFSENDASSMRKVEEFVEQIFQNRIKESHEIPYEIRLKYLLGSSPLFSAYSEGYLKKGSPDYEKDWGDVNSSMFSLLKRYGNEATVSRATTLYEQNIQAFRDSISRKLSGALLLKHAVANKKGNTKLDIFSGFETLVRLSDGNPRRIINLINKMWLKSFAIKGVGFTPINPKSQNEIFATVGGALLSKGRSEAVSGITVEDFIVFLGNFLSDRLHAERLSSDQYGSISYDDSLGDTYWSLIKKSIGWGLLFPIINSSNVEILPEKSGTFRLAYGLSAYFNILPRKGKSVSSLEILKDVKSRSTISRKMHDQLSQLALEFTNE